MRKPCDRDHDALRTDLAAFDRLELVDVQPAFTGDQADDIELRDCPCGSTLGRPFGDAARRERVLAALAQRAT